MAGQGLTTTDRSWVANRILSALLILYIGAILAWALGRAIGGDRWVLALFLSQLGPWLFAPTIIFLPWLLLGRRPLSLILLVIPLGLFLWHYGALLLPPRPPDVREPLTVVTFNVLATNREIEAMAHLIEGASAEIVALQELQGWQDRALSAALHKRYPHRWHVDGAGLAVYSVYPIVARQVLTVRAPTGAAEALPIQSAILRVGAREVHLLNAHLARAGIMPLLGRLDADPMRDSAAARAAQIDAIERAIRQRGLPAIVACDGNMTDLSAAYRRVAEALGDVWRERGWGLGNTLLAPHGLDIISPINLAVQRIDYLFYSSEIKPGRVRVITGDSGSDHRPVWAEFDLEPVGTAGKPGDEGLRSSRPASPDSG
jgi:endonuclease/exonuclease/phosphatase (EEP) superfamily protein YafD